LPPLIVGTVALSLGASFGMSVLLWQYILGIQLHWMVLAMSVIVLLAVGSDYNLLLVSRMKEDRRRHKHRHDPRDGRYWQGRDDCGTGVRRHHGLVVVSDLRIIGQIGTTIGLGLLFDTVIVRSFMTPSIAAVFGRWFWWPQRVRPRPASFLLRPYGTRMQVRELLYGDARPDDHAVTEEVPGRFDSSKAWPDIRTNRQRPVRVRRTQAVRAGQTAPALCRGGRSSAQL
jgi:RND superfamily putative drug exporter